MEAFHLCTPKSLLVGSLILPAMLETASQMIYKILSTWGDTNNGNHPLSF